MLAGESEWPRALQLFEDRREHDFSWLWCCSDDISLLELARAAQTLNRPDAQELLARAIDAGLPNTTKFAAMCKVFATDVAMKVTTEAVQLFGGYGYCKDYPIEKYMRDAKITQIYEGANQIQKLVIARNLIKEANGLAHLEEFIPVEEQSVYQEEEPAPKS